MYLLSGIRQYVLCEAAVRNSRDAAGRGDLWEAVTPHSQCEGGSLSCTQNNLVKMVCERP